MYQNSHLSGCAPADQFCAGSAVPAGGGTGQRPAVQRGRALCGAAVAAASSLALLAPTAPWSVGLLYKRRHRGAGSGRGLWLAGVAGFVRLLAWFWLLNLMLTGAVLLPGARMEVNNLSVYLPLSPEVLLVSAGCVYGGLTLALHLLGTEKRPVFRQSWRSRAWCSMFGRSTIPGLGCGSLSPAAGGAGTLCGRGSPAAACLTYLFKRNVFRERHPAPPELGCGSSPAIQWRGTACCLLSRRRRCVGRPGRQQTRHGLYAAFCDMPPPPPGWTLLVGSDVMEGS